MHAVVITVKLDGTFKTHWLEAKHPSFKDDQIDRSLDLSRLTLIALAIKCRFVVSGNFDNIFLLRFERL